MTRPTDVAAEFAARFATVLGAGKQDAVDALMKATPAELVAAQNRLINDGVRDMLGAFPIGPVFGDDVLPLDPVDAMQQGKAHRVPLIVGTNADEGRLFTRFLQLLPTNEPMIEALLAEVDPVARERITGAYPGLPRAVGVHPAGRRFRLRLGGVGDGRSPRQPRAHILYRYDYAPRVLRWSGLGATHATELLAVFGVLPHQARRVADRAHRSPISLAGHPRSAKVLAIIQPHGQPGRRLAGLHRHRPRGDGLRPQVPSRVRPAPRTADGLGRVFPGAMTVDVVSWTSHDTAHRRRRRTAGRPQR